MSVWRTVRVFVSSTFRDMHAERNHLVRVVFPALRERLQPYRVHLVDVDLRWGVTSEQVENNEVLGLCLGFVDDCRPFSVGLIGERYGWVPDRIPDETLARFPWLHEHRQRSLTELEIVNAAFRAPQRGKMYFFFRNPAAVAAIAPGPTRDIYVERDADAARLLEQLKGRIRQGGFAITEYSASWDPDAVDRIEGCRGQFTGLDEFGQRVSEHLWNGICAELRLDEAPAGAPPDELEEEADYHERFLESRVRVYVGRRELEAELRRFAAGTDPMACALTGPSGSGKSAALAHFVAAVRRLHPDWLVVPHFVGASPGSTDLRRMLRRFCLMLQADGGDRADVPRATAELVNRFDEVLRGVPAERRVVVVIDALNQLDTTDRAQGLEWLPVELPAHVKVVVSCIEDPERDEPALDALNARPHHLLRVETLTDVERFQIVHDVPMLSAKTLDHTQVALLLANPATANPLFLLVALEELRGFASYERLRDRIAALPRGFDALDALFVQVIERLEEDFGELLVRTTLVSLAAARRGLSERELRALVGSDDVYPVLRQLRSYLQPRGALLDFYHRNLFKAIRERYLATAEARRRAHAALAGFFDDQPFGAPHDINRRKVDELPWQRLQAEQWDSLDQLFSDPAFLEAKTEAGLVFDLAADFHAMLDRYPADRPMSRTLRLRNEALLRDIHFIARHPSTLFQCFWNSCWWYDSPLAATFYPVPEGGWLEPPPWERLGPRLCEWLETWRDERKGRGRLGPWLRALRPPARHLGRGARGQLAGREDSQFAGLAFIPGTNQLLAIANTRAHAGTWSSRLVSWNAESGEHLRDFAAIQDTTFGLSCTADGRFAVGGHGAVKLAPVWDVATRQFDGYGAAGVVSTDGRRAAAMTDDGNLKLYALHGHRADRLGTSAMAFSPDGRWIAAGRNGPLANGWHGELVLFDAQTGAELRVIHTSPHMHPPNSLAWFPDSRRLATGWNLGDIRVFDAGSGELLYQIHARDDDHVNWMSVSSDGRWLLTAAGDQVNVWDAATGARIRHLEGVDTHTVAASPDGRLLAAHGEGQNVITLWDLDDAEAHRRLEPGIAMAMSADGRWLAGGFGNNVWIRDFESGQPLLTVAAKPIKRTPIVQRAAFSPDAALLAAVVDDGTIRIWDLERRAERCLFDGTALPDARALAIARSLTFSPDGRWLATGTWRADAPDHCNVLILEVATGSLQILSGHENGINDVRYSPDGSILASASVDGTVRLWDAQTSELRRTLALVEPGARAVGQVWFTADGAGLIVVLSSLERDDDGRVWKLDLASGQATGMPDGDDPRVLAQRQPAHRFRGLVQSRRRLPEFTVKDAHTGQQIAWAPLYLGDSFVADFLAHPSGRMWAGRSDVVALEDAPEAEVT